MVSVLRRADKIRKKIQQKKRTSADVRFFVCVCAATAPRICTAGYGKQKEGEKQSASRNGGGAAGPERNAHPPHY